MKSSDLSREKNFFFFFQNSILFVNVLSFKSDTITQMVISIERSVRIVEISYNFHDDLIVSTNLYARASFWNLSINTSHRGLGLDKMMVGTANWYSFIHSNYCSHRLVTQGFCHIVHPGTHHVLSFLKPKCPFMTNMFFAHAQRLFYFSKLN